LDEDDEELVAVVVVDCVVVNDGKELHGRKAGRFRPLTSLPAVLLLIFGLLTHCHASTASSSSSNDEIMRGVGGRYKSLKFNPPHDESKEDDPHPSEAAKSSVTSADVRRRLIDPARDWFPFSIIKSPPDNDDIGNSSQLNNDLICNSVCCWLLLSSISSSSPSLTAGCCWWSRLLQSSTEITLLLLLLPDVFSSLASRCKRLNVLLSKTDRLRHDSASSIRLNLANDNFRTRLRSSRSLKRGLHN
jgi:hypothetical protein